MKAECSTGFPAKGSRVHIHPFGIISKFKIIIHGHYILSNSVLCEVYGVLFVPMYQNITMTIDAILHATDANFFDVCIIGWYLLILGWRCSLGSRCLLIVLVQQDNGYALTPLQLFDYCMLFYFYFRIFTLRLIFIF